MNLLRIVASMNPSAGGISSGIREIHPYLSELGVSTRIACLDDPASPWANDLNGDIICLGPTNNRYGYKPFLTTKLRELSSAADVAIIEGIWMYHSFAGYRALRDTKTPYFVYTHGMLDPWFKNAYPLKHLKKWLFWPWSDYQVLSHAAGVLFTTEQEKILARQSFWLYKANEIVVGYGTSPPPLDQTRQLSVFHHTFPHLHNKRIFLFLGRIHPKKGVDILIESFAKVAADDHTLHLVIAGPDQVGLSSSLQQRADSLGISDRITWPGMLSGDLKWGAFLSSEIFCLPSHQENFGIAVVEALACGLPVAISNQVNIADDVFRAGAGITHNDTVEDTINAYLNWNSYTVDKRCSIASRSKLLFEQSFNFSSVAKHLMPILSSCVN